MFVYGIVIVLLFAPLHECSHGTAFHTRWINHIVGFTVAALTFRPFLYFKYRHAAHHTYTQHEDRDPDIVPFPTSLRDYFSQIIGLSFWPKLIGTLWRGSTGRFTQEEREFLRNQFSVRLSWKSGCSASSTRRQRRSASTSAAPSSSSTGG